MTKPPHLYGYIPSGDEVTVSFEMHERAHFETRGGTGGGKSIFEIQRNQYLITPDSNGNRPSLIVIDATPDYVARNALLETCQEHGIPFSEFWIDKPSVSSFDIFQAFDLQNGNAASLSTKATAAAGCDSGTQYGPRYFRSVSMMRCMKAMETLRDMGEKVSLEAIVETMEEMDRKDRKPTEITNALAPLCRISNISNSAEGKQISIADVIEDRGVAYFALNILEYPIVAEIIARFVISTTNLVQIERKNRNAKPIRVFVSKDEWSQWASHMDTTLLTTTRKYHYNGSYLFQSFEQVANASAGLDGVLAGNTRIHAYFSTVGDEIQHLQSMCSEVIDTLGGTSGAGFNQRPSAREIYRPSLSVNEILDCTATDRDFFLVVNDGKGHKDPLRVTTPPVPDETLKRWATPPTWAIESASEPDAPIDAGLVVRVNEINTALQAFFEQRIARETYSD